MLGMQGIQNVATSYFNALIQNIYKEDGTVNQSLILHTLCIVVVCIFVCSTILPEALSSAKDEIDRDPSKVEVKKRDYTISQLREFDGSTEEKPIYISLKGDVYDVSSARHLYGPGCAYHCMAGREASRAMAKLSFDEEDLQSTETEDLNGFERGTLDDWIEKFRHYKGYPIVGRCVIGATVTTSSSLPTMTRAQLKEYRGKQTVDEGRVNASIYVGLHGKVFDVSFGGEELYGEGGPYHVFAGIDASRALAKMSFEKDDLESNDLSDLSDTQVKTLEEWVTRFSDLRKYPAVAVLS